MIEGILYNIFEAIKNNPYLFQVRIDWENNEITYSHKGDRYVISIKVLSN